MDGDLYHTSTNKKKVGVAILVSNRTDFKARSYQE